MNRRSSASLLATLCLFALSSRMTAADQPASDQSKVKDELKSLVLQDAKKPAAAPAPTVGVTPVSADQPAAAPATATDATPAPTASGSASGAAESAKPATAPVAGDTPLAADADSDPAGAPLVLPKVDVNRHKFTELDKLLQKEEKEMAAEAKNADSSELDDALNDDDVSLSILGGRTTQYRERVSKERLRMMSFEKDLIEAMAHTTDPAEKAELQKYIDEVKSMRRDLEGASTELEAGPR